MHNTWTYIFIMVLTTFIIRALPLILIRKEITNPWYIVIDSLNSHKQYTSPFSINLLTVVDDGNCILYHMKYVNVDL